MDLVQLIHEGSLLKEDKTKANGRGQWAKSVEINGRQNNPSGWLHKQPKVGRTSDSSKGLGV